MTVINRFDIATNVTDALIDVFDTMLSIPLELSDESRPIEAGERIGGIAGHGRAARCHRHVASP